ncbi:MAG: ribose ABC transporter [Rhodobacteraceae bacterium]|nr:ribose ABC transporter [Paracoccaceae bacterium]
MLIGIDPRLSADVLYTLKAMGHGDVLILSDANFPSDSIGVKTVIGRALTMENLSSAEAIEAILSVLPLDSFVDGSAGRMEVVDAPDEIPAVQLEAQAAIDAALGKSRPMIAIERFAFYNMAKEAYAVIQTGERRFYGCFMFRKGVIAPDAKG